MPQYFDAYHNQGILLSQSKEHEKAIESFRTGLRFAPDHAGILYDLGLAYSRAGKLDDAIRTYRRTIEVNPKDARAWNNMGTDLLDLGKLDDASSAYRSALQINPRHALAVNGLGVVENRRKNWPEAIRYYGLALDIEPERPLFLGNFVNACLSGNELESGLRTLQTLVDRLPDSTRIRFHLGSLHFNNRAYELAIGDFNEVVHRDSAYARAYLMRGLCRMMKDQWAQATADLAEAVKHSPKDIYNQLIQWVVHARHGDKDRCSAVASAVTAVAVDDEWGNSLAKYIAGQLSKDSLLEAAQNDEKRCEGYFYIAESIRLEQGPEAARSWYEKCVQTEVRYFLEYRLALWETIER